MVWLGVEGYVALSEALTVTISGMEEPFRSISIVSFVATFVVLFLIIRRADNVSEDIISYQNDIIDAQQKNIGTFSKALADQKSVLEDERKTLSETNTNDDLVATGKLTKFVNNIRSISLNETTHQTLTDTLLQEALKLTKSSYGSINLNVDNDSGFQPTSYELIGQTPIINNTPDDQNSIRGFPEGHPPIGNYLFVPLCLENKVIGTIGLANRPGGYDPGLVESVALVISLCMELVKTREQVQDKESLGNELLETMRDGVITFDEYGLITGLNSSARVLLLNPDHQFDNINVGDLLDLPGWNAGLNDKFPHYLNNLGTGIDNQVVSLTAKGQDGRTFRVEALFMPFRLNNKDYFHVMIRDRSQFWKAENSLRQAREETKWLEMQTTDIKKEIAESKLAEQQALANIERIERSSRTKFELLANMGNEICTPLSAIVGFSASILDKGINKTEGHQLDEYIEYINNTGHKLLEHIKESLDLSAIESGKMGIDPVDALAITKYARYSDYVRHDHDQVEALFQRALEVDPGNPVILSNYSLFRTSIRSDHEREDALYTYAIEADPDSPLANGSYAVFLSDVRKHNARAEEYYKIAIKLDPNNAVNLANYAKFLTNVYSYHDRAESLFKRATQAGSDNAKILSDYAYFLIDVRKDVNQADVWFQRAIEAAPDDLLYQKDYAMFKLVNDEQKHGLQLLETIIPVLQNEDLIEALFYAYICSTSTGDRTRALIKIHDLLLARVRSPLFDPFSDIRSIVENAHPESKLINVLARVITVRSDLSSLDQFKKWKSLKDI